MEADPSFGRRGRWIKERLELLPDDLQGFVVLKKRFVDLRKPFEDFGVGGDLFAHLDEGADDINAHGDGFRTIQQGGSHDGPVLGEDAGRNSNVPMFR